VKTLFLTLLPTMSVEKLLAKTKIPRQAQFLNFAQSLLELFAIMIILGKKQNILMAAIGQFCRQDQEVRANRIQSSHPVIFGQAQPFEPMDNVGGKQEQLKEGHIGFPGFAGYFAQGVIVKEFAVVLFYRCPGIVKQINSPGRHLEVGHENMINVFGIFEQSQLFGFLGVFRDRTPDYDKPMRAGPFLMDIFGEFPRFPAIVESLESTPPRSGFDSGIFFGYDDIPASHIVEESDYPLTVESRIHPEANPASGYVLRRFGQANLQEDHCSGGRGSIARAQSSVPEFLTMSFETKERMIRAPSRLSGIVADSSPLLSAIDGNYHGIQIEDQTVAFAGQSPEMRPEAVVQPGQLANRLWTQPFQEPPQSRLIRETAQSQNLQEEAVVLQDFGLVDALQPHNDGIQQSQDQFGRMVNLILLRKTNMLLQKLFEPKLLAKTVNQEHSTIMRQVAASEENFDFSGTFWHNTQTSLLVHFLCEEFDDAYYTPFSSENLNLKSKNRQFSRIFEDKPLNFLS